MGNKKKRIEADEALVDVLDGFSERYNIDRIDSSRILGKMLKEDTVFFEKTKRKKRKDMITLGKVPEKDDDFSFPKLRMFK